tara:strand:+ start:475 stop:597 length:123 start_codon:yes stop_codon:yes gene_type:complete
MDEKVYTISVSFQAKDMDDAENFVDSMSRNDWINSIKEEK